MLLERQENTLIDFADKVYLNDEHMEVFSSAIARQLYEVGIIAEAVMKKTIFELHSRGELDDDSAKVQDIRDYRKSLEPILHLSAREVTFILYTYQRTFRPFLEFAEIDPQSN